MCFATASFFSVFYLLCPISGEHLFTIGISQGHCGRHIPPNCCQNVTEAPSVAAVYMEEHSTDGQNPQ